MAKGAAGAMEALTAEMREVGRLVAAATAAAREEAASAAAAGAA